MNAKFIIRYGVWECEHCKEYYAKEALAEKCCMRVRK